MENRPTCYTSPAAAYGLSQKLGSVLKTAEVINDMLDKGLIKSDNSLLAPGYALPEFYTETGKYKLPHLRR